MDNRSFQSGAAASAPTAPASPSSGYPTNGNPSTGTPATLPGAYWFHQIGEEIRNVITSAALTPAAGVLNQLYLAIESICQEIVDNALSTLINARPEVQKITWTDAIDVATATYSSAFAVVKNSTFTTPIFNTSSKIALIMYQSSVHCYSDGTNGHGQSIEWQLLLNGNVIATTQTNATSSDDTVHPIIFNATSSISSGLSNTLALKAKVYSTSGHAITNHGQFPSAANGGQSEINIIYL